MNVNQPRALALHYVTECVENDKKLDEILNKYWRNGYRLVCMTECPRRTYSDCTGYIAGEYTLVFERIDKQ